MDFFLQEIANGLVTGSTYALVALGFSLIFGIMAVLNLAYPDIYMWGAFGAFAAAVAGFPVWVVAVAAIVSSSAWSVAVDRLVFRNLRNSAFLTPFIAAVGVSIFLENLAVRVFGPEAVGVAPLLPAVEIHLGPVRLAFAEVVTVVGAVSFMIGLSLLVERTWLGKAIKATAENPEAARALGINTDLVALEVSIIAGSLAGLAGFLIVALYSQVFAFMGIIFGLKAMVVMVLGGLGNIPGAMIGGFALGILEALITGYVSSSYAGAIAFFVLIGVLVARPQGLFGEKLGWR